MNDREWLDRIRAQNRRDLGLEGLRGAVLDAPGYRVLGRAGSSARPATVVTPSLRGLGAAPSAPAPSSVGGLLLGAGATCLVAAFAFKHGATAKRNLALAGLGLLVLGAQRRV